MEELFSCKEKLQVETYYLFLEEVFLSGILEVTRF